MIEESATVVATEGELAWVETQRQSACGSCAARSGCGSAALSKVLGQRRTRVRAVNQTGARVGDSVIVGIRERALVRGSLAVYAVPLVALLSVALLGDILASAFGANREAMTILFGLAGLLAGLGWLRRFAGRVSRDPRYQPVILRRISDPRTAGPGALAP
ncbi:MAG: SoxR reducing system RseC family protein [Gammaproteobacteria bacterium]|nr:SoxR reducing system RseC family protein [Gammaproteobacteria bacterium]NIR32877.1 SoxR reducing system RseC family protein [Gammaproteobacteria bacterium]NIR99423.1 SoxR reducing system RseC family protein [Gammaproteobacteria bacterium]NIT65037.1 SoxR reducing system RseC family protein [Gammaproteobacteria bacterium]NIV21952.1 Fis family transcriptional regulator [Gammaproteobacteria bacterium]